MLKLLCYSVEHICIYKSSYYFKKCSAGLSRNLRKFEKNWLCLYGAWVTLIKIEITQQRGDLTCIGQRFFVAQISTIEWHTKLHISIESERDILILTASLERHTKIIFDHLHFSNEGIFCISSCSELNENRFQLFIICLNFFHQTSNSTSFC